MDKVKNKSIGRMVMRHSTSGHAYAVWEPALPRISDEYLDCIVYLYPSEIDAEKGEKAGVAVFLLAFNRKDCAKIFGFYMLSQIST